MAMRIRSGTVQVLAGSNEGIREIYPGELATTIGDRISGNT